VEAQQNFSQTFSAWLKVCLLSSAAPWVCLSSSGSRLEQRFTSKSTLTSLSDSVPLILGKTSSQVLFLRKSHGTRLSIFSPVNDLSSLSRSGPQRSLIRGQTNDVVISGGQVLGDEYSDHVVKVCPLADECLSHQALTSDHRIEAVSFCERGKCLLSTYLVFAVIHPIY
jgi:hypothetical protein